MVNDWLAGRAIPLVSFPPRTSRIVRIYLNSIALLCSHVVIRPQSARPRFQQRPSVQTCSLLFRHMNSLIIGASKEAITSASRTLNVSRRTASSFSGSGTNRGRQMESDALFDLTLYLISSLRITAMFPSELNIYLSVNLVNSF